MLSCGKSHLDVDHHKRAFKDMAAGTCRDMGCSGATGRSRGLLVGEGPFVTCYSSYKLDASLIEAGPDICTAGVGSTRKSMWLLGFGICRGDAST